MKGFIFVFTGGSSSSQLMSALGGKGIQLDMILEIKGVVIIE